MEHIKSGNLVIRTMEEKLVFEIHGSSLALAEVPAEDLPVILEFINAHRAAHANRRMGFRLDLQQLDPTALEQFQVTVDIGAGAIPVQPIDLSITGIRVDSDTLEGQPGMQAILTLAFEDHSVALSAVLVRHSESIGRFAFHFPEIFGENGRLSPPRELTEICYALESLWLNENLDLKWNLA
jgi:hypothetical protein